MLRLDREQTPSTNTHSDTVHYGGFIHTPTPMIWLVLVTHDGASTVNTSQQFSPELRQLIVYANVRSPSHHSLDLSSFARVRPRVHVHPRNSSDSNYERLKCQTSDREEATQILPKP